MHSKNWLGVLLVYLLYSSETNILQINVHTKGCRQHLTRAQRNALYRARRRRPRRRNSRRTENSSNNGDSTSNAAQKSTTANASSSGDISRGNRGAGWDGRGRGHFSGVNRQCRNSAKQGWDDNPLRLEYVRTDAETEQTNVFQSSTASNETASTAWHKNYLHGDGERSVRFQYRDRRRWRAPSKVHRFEGTFAGGHLARIAAEDQNGPDVCGEENEKLSRCMR